MVGRQSERTLKPHNYAHIILDPNKANADYLVGFYNSEIGKTIRGNLFSPTFISHINRAALRESIVYLPTLEEQLHIMEVQNQLTDEKTRYEILLRSLWIRPSEVLQTHISPSIRAFEEWIETLPIPLASLLWLYHGASEAEAKYTTLLNFFEVFTVYTCIVLLSAASSNIDMFNKYYSKICKNYKLGAPSMGGWLKLGKDLAVKTREILSTKTDTQISQEIFFFANDDFRDWLVDEHIFDLLTDATLYRNQWKGHDGRATRSDIKSRLVRLESLLSNLRQILAEKHKAVTLVRPLQTNLERNTFQQNVYRLQCTRTPPLNRILEVWQAMDSAYLYLKSDTALNGLRLLPIMRVFPDSSDYVCHFYNGLNNNEIRWVTYQSEISAELFRPDDFFAEDLTQLGFFLNK